MNEWLSVARAAEHAKVPRRTLYDWARVGRVRARRDQRGRVSVNVADVARERDAHAAAPPAPLQSAPTDQLGGENRPDRSRADVARGLHDPSVAAARSEVERLRLQAERERLERQLAEERQRAEQQGLAGGEGQQVLLLERRARTERMQWELERDRDLYQRQLLAEDYRRADAERISAREREQAEQRVRADMQLGDEQRAFDGWAAALIRRIRLLYTPATSLAVADLLCRRAQVVLDRHRPRHGRPADLRAAEAEIVEDVLATLVPAVIELRRQGRWFE